MNTPQDESRILLEEALKLLWKGVDDQILLSEYEKIDISIPRGLILDDKRVMWKGLILKKFILMNEISQRFGNA